MYIYYDLSRFLMEGLMELAIYGIYFLVIVTMYFILRKSNSKIAYVGSIFVMIGCIGYLYASTTRLEMLEAVLFALMLTGVWHVMGLMNLQGYEMLLVFCTFLIPERLFNSSFSLWGDGIYYVLVFLVLTIFSLGSEKGGRLLSRYFISIYLSLCIFIYRYLGSKFYEWYQVTHIFSNKGYIFLMIVLTAVFISLAYILRRTANKQLLALKRLELRNLRLSKWSLVFTCISFGIFLIAPLPFVLSGSMTGSQHNFIAIFDLLILILQMAYMIFLYRIMDYRQEVTVLEKTSAQKESYYAMIDDNLEAMGNLRHDIKNIFLTMTNFVERSDDLEMKQFYYENIYPISESEIEKNYLLTRLLSVPGDELRAFLYMKLYQAMQKRIEVKLEILIAVESFQYGMEFMDLTRVLGILLDNAVEECEQIASGSKIQFKIVSNEREISYILKNSIREGHNFKHMDQEISDKGVGRGRGLKIVKKIIEFYPNVRLNTHLSERWFTQSMNIMKES